MLKKTGRLLKSAAIIATLFTHSAFAANNKASAEVDRNEISLEESLNLSIEASGPDSDTASVNFEAPDFDPINQYESQQYRGTWINNKYTNSSSKIFTVVLRPKRAGKLKIKNIRVKFADGQSENAADLSVNVSSAGSGPTKDMGGTAPKVGSDERMFFLRTEVNKPKVYRGEQIIVSYYIYRRTRIQIREVLKYPNFSDFVREDMEMPILSGRLDFEAVSVGGVPYERALVARYAIYPIKTGSLKVDNMSLKVDYVPRSSKVDEFFDDPIFQFFNQVNPRSAARKSDVITIDSLPLPEGASTAFSGAVGQFDIRWETQAGTPSTNNPYSLFLKIKGKGNFSEMQEPKIEWPSSLRVYESKGSSKNLSQGDSEKTFEIVVIPKEVGRIELPAVPFEYFDVGSKEYVRKQTAPLVLNVTQGAAADPLAESAEVDEPKTEKKANASEQNLVLNPKPLDSASRETPRSFLGQPWWRWLFWSGLLLVIVTGIVVTLDTLRIRSKHLLKLKSAVVQSDSFKKWLSEAAGPVNEISHTTKLDDLISRWLNQNFHVIVSSMTRKELAQALSDKSLNEKSIQAIVSMLRLSEEIRFSGSNAGENKSHPSFESLKSVVQEFAENP